MHCQMGKGYALSSHSYVLEHVLRNQYFWMTENKMSFFKGAINLKNPKGYNRAEDFYGIEVIAVGLGLIFLCIIAWLLKHHSVVCC